MPKLETEVIREGVAKGTEEVVRARYGLGSCPGDKFRQIVPGRCVSTAGAGFSKRTMPRLVSQKPLILDDLR